MNLHYSVIKDEFIEELFFSLPKGHIWLCKIPPCWWLMHFFIISLLYWLQRRVKIALRRQNGVPTHFACFLTNWMAESVQKFCNLLLFTHRMMGENLKVDLKSFSSVLSRFGIRAFLICLMKFSLDFYFWNWNGTSYS